MSKKPDKPDEPVIAPVEPAAPAPVAPTPAAPISIMGEPKAPVQKEEFVTLKSFTELKDAYTKLENKINEFIPKPTVAPTAPEPKAYKLFDELAF